MEVNLSKEIDGLKPLLTITNNPNKTYTDLKCKDILVDCWINWYKPNLPKSEQVYRKEVGWINKVVNVKRN